MRREVERLQALNTQLEEGVMLRDIEQHPAGNGVKVLFRSMDQYSVAQDTERVAREAFSVALDAARVDRERKEPFEVYEAREVPQRVTLPPEAYAVPGRTVDWRRDGRTRITGEYHTRITLCLQSGGDYRCGLCCACEAYEAPPYV